jgi:transcriptional regulator with XRE-family HTH domain
MSIDDLSFVRQTGFTSLSWVLTRYPERRRARELEPSEVVAANIRAGRALAGMTQEQLTEAMRRRGHRWAKGTISRIETGSQAASIDELASLALELGRPLPEFFVPPAGERLHVGSAWMNPGSARLWATGTYYLKARWTQEGRELAPDVLHPTEEHIEFEEEQP